MIPTVIDYCIELSYQYSVGLFEDGCRVTCKTLRKDEGSRGHLAHSRVRIHCG